MMGVSRHDIKQYKFVLLEASSAFHAIFVEFKGLYLYQMLNTKVNMDFVEPP